MSDWLNMSEGYKAYLYKLASKVNIVDFLSSEGYDGVQKGSNLIYKQFGDSNSFTVSPSKNSFIYFAHQSEGAKGGVIQCAEYILGLTKEDAIDYLLDSGLAPELPDNWNKGGVKITPYQRKETPPPIQEEKPDSIEPPPICKEGFRQLYAYLMKSRGLSKDIVDMFVKTGRLYPVKNEYGYINIFFEHTLGGKCVGGQFTGTSTTSKFKKNLSGAKGNRGYFMNTAGKNVQKIYLFEAPIDMMSYMDMHRNELKTSLFVAMGGCMNSIAEFYINNPKQIPVISCVDNDQAGIEFNEKYADKDNFGVCTECKDNEVKDFNELLLKLRDEQAVRDTVTPLIQATMQTKQYVQQITAQNQNQNKTKTGGMKRR